jgi:hypothetical protein
MEEESWDDWVLVVTVDKYTDNEFKVDAYFRNKKGYVAYIMNSVYLSREGLKELASMLSSAANKGERSSSSKDPY